MTKYWIVSDNSYFCQHLFIYLCIYLFPVRFKCITWFSLPLLQCAFNAKAAVGKRKEKKKKKVAPVSLYIAASQTAWRCPSAGSWACEELRELPQAAAVNKDWF